LAADEPVAMVAVRLSDVARDDSATRVSYRLLSLNHYARSHQPRALGPGRKPTVTAQLRGLAQSVPAGARRSISVATSYWPVVWPSPEAFRLTIDPNESALILPIRPASIDDDSTLIPPFGPPEGAPSLSAIQVEPGEQDWIVSRNLV